MRIKHLVVAMAVAGAYSTSALAQTEIQWWHSMQGALGEALNGLADKFNASQKDYKVVTTYKGQYPESLDLLVAKEPPSGVSEDAKSRWNGPYLKKGLPRDPWSRAYEYQRLSQHHIDYDLSSYGPDGQPGHDDVTNWE